MTKLSQKNAARRKIFIFCIAAVLTLTTSTSAFAATYATQYPWGPHFFTPYTGAFSVSRNSVEVADLCWTSSQISEILSEQSQMGPGAKATIEFEFRPQGYSTHDIWSQPQGGTLESDLPSYFFEFQKNDYDDVTIGSRAVGSVLPEKKYSGTLTLTPMSNAPTSFQYVFESEFGAWIPLASDLVHDSVPYYYEQFDKYTYLGQTYTWYWRVNP